MIAINQTSSQGIIRYGYIDRVRGLAMLLVVMGHVILFSEFNGLQVEKSCLFQIIGLFHMPLFFTVSGVNVKYDYDVKHGARKLCRRTLQLIIPFLILGSLYTYTLGSHSFVDFLSSYMKEGYWFLWVLFVYYLLNFVLIIVRRYVRSIVVDVLVVSSLYILLRIFYSYCGSDLQSWLSLPQIISYFPYFFMASMIAQYGLLEKLLSNEWVRISVLVGAPLGCFFILSGVGHLRIIVRLLCILFVWVVMYMTKTNNSKAFLNLEKWGRNTIWIYTLHYFVVAAFCFPFIGRFFINHYSIGLELIVTLPLALLCLEIAHLVGCLLSKIELVRKYFLFKC